MPKTTIAIDKKTRARLDELCTKKGETYNDIIIKLLDRLQKGAK